MGTFPTTPNVWAPRNGTGANGCNLAAVKIAFNFAGVAADPRSVINGRYDSSGCVPLDVLFKDTVHNAKLYIWNFGDGTPDTATTAFQVLHTYTNIGTYTVRLIAIDSSTCNISDTAYLRIRVRTDRAILDFDISKLPPCQSLNYHVYQYLHASCRKTFPAQFIYLGFWRWHQMHPGPVRSHMPMLLQVPIMVQLILSDTNYCNYPDTVTQYLAGITRCKSQFEISDGCAPYNAILIILLLPDKVFFGILATDTTSTDINPVHIYTDTEPIPLHFLPLIRIPVILRDSTTHTIHVYPKPTADFTTLPIPAQYNTPTIFTNNSIGATHYIWLFRRWRFNTQKFDGYGYSPISGNKYF